MKTTAPAKTKEIGLGFITELDRYLFGQGTHYKIFEKLGAHPKTYKGKAGMYFAVWAPHAKAVGVVGDFNGWDPDAAPMSPLADSGIYEAFIPGVGLGELYKFAITTQEGMILFKADPYAVHAEFRPGTASITEDINGFKWDDAAWMETRKKADPVKSPMAIYEVHLGSWRKKDRPQKEGYYTYMEAAHELADYVKKMGYTHVELMGIAEHPYDGSWGYQVTGYYAPTSRYGTPKEFMYFVNYLHKKGIGIILDWVPAHFPKDAHGLADFDGQPLYEYADPRKGEHPDWGTKVFDYSKNEVKNFLIANALYWVENFHVDGLRVDAVASMLYLDYGKNPGEWVANMYGGHENLEAVEFLKHLNSVFKGRKDGAVLIAEESTAWPKVTGNVKEDGLGFDYKWNMGWMNDFLGYMKCDPYFRCHHYGELTFSMIYAYSEDFILVFSHDEVVHGKGSKVIKMPGETFEAKFANLRAAYGFMTGHPGKKLLFMGQEFGQMDEWNENKSLEWELLEYPIHKNMQSYVKALNFLYREHPALYEEDYMPDGFEWINCMDSANNIAAFLRKTDKPEETLLFVCNFAPVEHEKYKMGVPFPGKYKEIFNSESKNFGGCGIVNPRVKSSKAEECDGREESITVHIAPLGISVFSCTPVKRVKKTARTAGKTAKSKAAGTGRAVAAGRSSGAAGGRRKASVQEKAPEGNVIAFKADKSLYGTLADLREDDEAKEALKQAMDGQKKEGDESQRKTAQESREKENKNPVVTVIKGAQKALQTGRRSK